MTREEALSQLEEPLYNSRDLKTDKEYVLKKFGLPESEFDDIMQLPPRKHQDFKTDKQLKESYMNLLRKTEPIRKALKK